MFFFSFFPLHPHVIGIRCEKASAYIRNQTNAKEVYHLRGGIHKYLETYGSDGLFYGKNFVFDRRGSDAPRSNNNDTIVVVGKCFYCHCDWDQFTDVCCVCREPMLICPECHLGKKENHCRDHEHLKECYFTNLSIYTTYQLQQQKTQLENHLEKIAVGKKYKQRRKTITKQIERIVKVIADRGEDDINKNATSTNLSLSNDSKSFCRRCGMESCTGKVDECWEFYGCKIKDHSEVTYKIK